MNFASVALPPADSATRDRVADLIAILAKPDRTQKAMDQLGAAQDAAEAAIKDAADAQAKAAANVAAADQAVRDAEQKLAALQAEHGRVSDELSARETAVNEREQAHVQEASNFADMVANMQAVLSKREDDVKAREERADAREKRLDARQETLAAQENDYQARIARLKELAA